MKKIIKYIGIIIIIVTIILPTLYINNRVGICKKNIEKDARTQRNLDDSWEVSKSTNKNISALIFYDNEQSKSNYSIYVNKKGLSFGYFFRGGGSTYLENKGIVEYQIEGFQEKAYISMNKDKISRVEIDKGNNIKVINIESTKPFALVLDKDAITIRFYDINDNVIKPIYQKL